jgi:tRNA/tmRNA/rRNA uracil-C5-methylase (TrmA/RlmC/RlmD family)
VRFVGDEVVRVETMKVDGQKVVRTKRKWIWVRQPWPGNRKNAQARRPR